MPTFPDIGALAVPFYIACIIFEICAVRFFQARGTYETRDTATSLAMGSGNVVVESVFSILSYVPLLWAYEHRLYTLGFGWAAVLSCFVLDDFRYYWKHRIAHRCRWVWAMHVNHHSSQHYNLSTALRQPWTDMFTGTVILRMPLAFMGFHPAVIALAGAANLIYQFWIHTEAIRTMPTWFEAVFNTPSHHRVHHGTNARYLDANYAGVFIVWDKLFGTFVPERADDPVHYGLTSNLGTFNPLRVAVHEYVAIAADFFRAGLSWRERLSYLFAPPGWSHDGSRNSTAMLKSAYVTRHPDTAGQPGLPAR